LSKINPPDRTAELEREIQETKQLHQKVRKMESEVNRGAIAELERQLQELEKRVDIGESEIEKAVEETKQLYRDIRKIESQFDKIMRLAGMMELPALSAVKGITSQVTPLISLMFQVAEIVVEHNNERERRRAEKERENERIKLRRELITEISKQIEIRRREQYRGVVPG
jgi:SMC interacting uncharacterized protein involved in chromosome segregation